MIWLSNYLLCSIANITSTYHLNLLNSAIANMFIVAEHDFLGSALSFTMLYTWSRRNADVRMSFLGFFQFNAPYLPWVMLMFSALLGNSVTMDLIGIAVGHTYYFLEFVYPVVAEIREWRIRRVMEPPMLLHWICGTYEEQVHLHQD